MENKVTKLTIFVILINTIAFGFSLFICLNNDVFNRLSGKGYVQDRDWLTFSIVILSAINFCFSFLSRKLEGENLIYLILKRKRLEEQKRIRDLEK